MPRLDPSNAVSLAILRRKAYPEHVLVGTNFRNGVERAIDSHLQQRVSSSLQHLLKRALRRDLIAAMRGFAQQLQTIASAE